MADEALIDPSTLPHKEQQQLVARLRHDGMRSAAYNRITDYQNATPTFKKVPKKRKSRAKAKIIALDSTGTTVEVTDPLAIANIRSGRMNDYSMNESMGEVDRVLMAVMGGKMTDPVPYHPNSKQALLARLNANLNPSKELNV